MTPLQRQQLREALVVFAAVTAVCAILWRLRGIVPWVGQYMPAIIAALFLYVPTVVLTRRHEDQRLFALTAKPVLRGLVYFAVSCAVVFPLFTLGFVYYYKLICIAEFGGAFVQQLYLPLCAHFKADMVWYRPTLPPQFVQVVLGQLLVVALPEEYFFRGYLLTRLEQVWPSKKTLGGAAIGPALYLSSLLFALGHVLVDFNGLRMAVFFPALVFGWMRQATGSILAGVLFHATCNIVSDLLHRTYF